MHDKVRVLYWTTWTIGTDATLNVLILMGVL
jgi:hypothetical protein